MLTLAAAMLPAFASAAIVSSVLPTSRSAGVGMPLTNALTGSPDTPIDIVEGAAQSFVLHADPQVFL